MNNTLTKAMVQRQVPASSLRQESLFVPGGPSRVSERKSRVDHGSTLSCLLTATIKNPQYRPTDFSKLANFPLPDQIRPGSVNMPTFVFGCFKQLLA